MANARQSALLRSLRKPLLLLSLLGAPLALGGTGVLSGCSGGTSGTAGTGGGSSATCFDYTTFKADTTVTFATGVLPILRTSCGLSTSCHQSESPSAPAQHFFGNSIKMPTPTAMQIQEIFDQSVGKASVDEPAMKVIDPGKPETSFLMYKLDGELTCDKLACAANKTCLTSMPQGSPVLAQADRDKIRSWIKNGAMNN